MGGCSILFSLLLDTFQYFHKKKFVLKVWLSEKNFSYMGNQLFDDAKLNSFP